MNTPEITRLHRLTALESEVVYDFRLLSTEAKQAFADLAKSMSRHSETPSDNVVPLRD